MRDIIWTLIVIWLLYKVVAMFRGNTSQKTQDSSNHDQSHADFKGKNETDSKSAIKKHLNNEGEYVDYEEIK